MLRSTLLPEIRITEFYGRPDDWGPVVRVIKVTAGRVTHMTTIGHRIAAACDNGTVSVYDSTTGALRVSLNPAYPTEAVRGSPDGTILFCTHRESPSITLWDIQTGGLIHTFALESEVNDTAVSLNGRYLACGSSDGSVRFWEVANRMESPTFGNGLPVTHLCWLAPEELLAVANLASLRIWDVVARTVRYALRIPDSICGAAYSQKLNQLAIMANLGTESIITTIDSRTGVSSISCRIQQQLSCLAFSQTTKEIVCGMQTHGMQLFNIPMKRWRGFDHPATITSVSTLSNGIVVANSPGSGIQLLNLDSGYGPSGRPITPAVAVHSIDPDGIVAMFPATRDHIILLRATIMVRLTRIPTRGAFLADNTVVPCASLVHEMAVYCFIEGGKKYLQLWKFSRKLPEWFVETDELPLLARISPTGTRVVTFHTLTVDIHGCIYIRDTETGRILASLLTLDFVPLDVTFDSFDSETRFYFHHTTYRIPYVLTPSVWPGGPENLTIGGVPIPLWVQPRNSRFSVDDSHEWVVSDSQRICWIPPGYIGSIQASYCWAGSSLVMVGEDGALRRFTLREK